MRHRRAGLQILAQALEKRMPDFACRRLRAIFDLGEQLRFDPDAAMGNLLGVRPRLADQWLKFLAQFFGPGFVEAMIDLAGIDQVLALTSREIEAIPFAAVEREAGN